MSLQEKTLPPIFTDINPNTKTISVAIDTVIEKDGAQIAKQRNRRAFVPGDIEKVKSFTGMSESPEIDYLNAIWTQEVIDEYKASIATDTDDIEA